LNIRFFEESDRPAWDHFVYAHPFGTPFHLIAWRQSISETFAYRPLYLLAERGGEIEAVLPMFEVRNFLVGRALISTPFAVYGGILATSAQAHQAMVEQVRSFANQMAVEYVELRNAWPDQVAGFEPVSRYVTFTQEIQSGDEAILETIPRKTRYMVRKALRHSYTSRTTQDRGPFEELYSRSLQKLGTPCFPSRHFAALQRNFGEKLEIREILLDGKVVAAVLSFYFNDRILPYYGASDPAFNFASPNNFMYFELMRQSALAGCAVFDFGRSKKEGSGSFDFKSHWGMRMRDLPYEMLLVKRKQLPHYSPNNPSFRWAIKAWQHVPLPVTRLIGPHLVRLVP
jgi:FemAB-related protein (PEP-CTERM system-associated)